MTKTLNWQQDGGDFSWFATDSLGYFYRVTKVMVPDGSWLFTCAWSETNGLRVSVILYADPDRAKAAMDNLAAFCDDEDTEAESSTNEYVRDNAQFGVGA